MTTEIIINDLNYYGYGGGCADISGYPHFAFRESGNLFHVWFDGTNWNSEQVVNKASGTLYGSAIGVFNGFVHIVTVYRGGVYPNYTWKLLYNTNTTGSWIEEELHSGTNTLAEYCYLTIDNTGTIHIVWCENTKSPNTRHIRYTYGTSGSWNTETVLSDMIIGADMWGVFRIQHSDVVHIVTMNSADLVLFSRTDGSWSSSVIISGVANEVYAVEFVISGTTMHAIYFDGGDNMLYHSYNGGSGWSAPKGLVPALDSFQNYVWAGMGCKETLNVIAGNYGPNPNPLNKWGNFIVRYYRNGEWSNRTIIDTTPYEVYSCAFVASAKGWWLSYSPYNDYVGLLVTYELCPSSPEPYPDRVPDIFYPPCKVETLTASDGAIFVQPDGPGTRMVFLGCHQVEGIDEPLGDYVVSYCSDVSKNKKWITVSEIVSPSGAINLSISEDMTTVLSYLVELKCPFPLYVTFSPSGRKDVFENSVLTFIIDVKKVTNRTIDNVVLIESDERIVQTLALTASPPIIEARSINVVGKTINGAEINDIVFY